jgi:hypothetical protein
MQVRPLSRAKGDRDRHRSSHRRRDAHVRAYDQDPFVTVTVGSWCVGQTREQARQSADALRAVAVTAVDELFE